jgi:hypothetical protein
LDNHLDLIREFKFTPRETILPELIHYLLHQLANQAIGLRKELYVHIIHRFDYEKLGQRDAAEGSQACKESAQDGKFTSINVDVAKKRTKAYELFIEGHPCIGPGLLCKDEEGCFDKAL